MHGDPLGAQARGQSSCCMDQGTTRLAVESECPLAIHDTASSVPANAMSGVRATSTSLDAGTCQSKL